MAPFGGFFWFATVVVVGLSGLTFAVLPAEDPQEDEDSVQCTAGEMMVCPQPLDLQGLFRQLNSLPRTQFLQSAVCGVAMGSQNEGSRFIEPNLLEEETGCPNHIARRSGEPLASRSLCPFYFRTLQLPKGYFPSTLETARCRCQRCVGHGTLGCQPVYSNVTVLKPDGCQGGLQAYTKVTFSIATSCTCAF